MDWMSQVGDLLQQYTGDQTPQQAESDDTLQQVLQNVPQSALASGLASAFRAEQTEPFGQMTAQLFSQADGQQRAGLLNTLLAAAGPTIISQIIARGGSSTSLLTGLLGGGGQPQVTPEVAQQVSPEVVRELATQTEQQDPSVIDRISDFYSQHPALVKSVGAMALGVIMAKLSQRQ